jgi:hypothetical protein
MMVQRHADILLSLSYGEKLEREYTLQQTPGTHVVLEL